MPASHQMIHRKTQQSESWIMEKALGGSDNWLSHPRHGTARTCLLMARLVRSPIPTRSTSCLLHIAAPHFKSNALPTQNPQQIHTFHSQTAPKRELSSRGVAPFFTRKPATAVVSAPLSFSLLRVAAASANIAPTDASPNFIDYHLWLG